jgi:hypothetical protein
VVLGFEFGLTSEKGHNGKAARWTSPQFFEGK